MIIRQDLLDIVFTEAHEHSRAEKIPDQHGGDDVTVQYDLQLVWIDGVLTWVE